MVAVLVIGVSIAIGALWVVTPIALFGVRNRLSGVEAAYRRGTDEVIAELRQVNATLQAEGDRLFSDPVAADRTLVVRTSTGGTHA